MAGQPAFGVVATYVSIPTFVSSPRIPIMASKKSPSTRRRAKTAENNNKKAQTVRRSGQKSLVPINAEPVTEVLPVNDSGSEGDNNDEDSDYETEDGEEVLPEDSASIIKASKAKKVTKITPDPKMKSAKTAESPKDIRKCK